MFCRFAFFKKRSTAIQRHNAGSFNLTWVKVKNKNVNVLFESSLNHFDFWKCWNWHLFIYFLTPYLRWTKCIYVSKQLTAYALPEITGWLGKYIQYVYLLYPPFTAKTIIWSSLYRNNNHLIDPEKSFIHIYIYIYAWQQIVFPILTSPNSKITAFTL